MGVRSTDFPRAELNLATARSRQGLCWLGMMPDLRAIDGGKAKRAKTLAEARILKCDCGKSSVLLDGHINPVVDKNGKTLHRGTPVRICAGCGRVIE